MIEVSSLSVLKMFEDFQSLGRGLNISNIFEMFDVQNFEISRNNIFENDVCFFLKHLEKSVGRKVENNWCGWSWSCPLGPKRMKMMTFRLAQSEIEKLLSQNEAE